MNNEQLSYNNESAEAEKETAPRSEEGQVTPPETEAAQPETEAAQPEAGVAGGGIGAFLTALSEKEKKMLLCALARLAESERLREKEARRARELAAIAEMENSPVFAGISARADAIFALCHSVPWLSELPLHERLSAAYFIDRGMRYGEPTKEDLLRAVLSDGELQRALEEHRHAARVAGAAALPPVSRRRGTATAPAAVKAKAKTLAEASDEAKKYLRFYK